MNKLLREGSRERRWLGIGAVFTSILVVYGAAYAIVGMHAVGIAVAYAGALLVYLMRRWKPHIPSYDYQLRNIESLISLSPLRTEPVIPFSGMALDGLELSKIVSEVVLNETQTVVECGSGVSTMMLANLFKALDRGHVYALEEDGVWFKLMQRLIQDRELGGYVTLLHAPTNTTIGPGRWYDTTVAQQILDAVERIDVLIVDGPQARNGQSRYGALPFFLPKLGSTSLIFLHDVCRGAESEVLLAWQRELGAHIEDVFMSTKDGRGLACIRVKIPPEPEFATSGAMTSCLPSL